MPSRVSRVHDISLSRPCRCGIVEIAADCQRKLSSWLREKPSTISPKSAFEQTSTNPFPTFSTTFIIVNRALHGPEITLRCIFGINFQFLNGLQSPTYDVRYRNISPLKPSMPSLVRQFFFFFFFTFIHLCQLLATVMYRLYEHRGFLLPNRSLDCTPYNILLPLTQLSKVVPNTTFLRP